MTRHRKCAAGIEIQPSRVDRRALGGAGDGPSPLGNDTTSSNLHFIDTAARMSILQQNSPRLRLRIAIDAGHRDHVIDRVTPELFAYHAQGFVSSGLFMSEHRSCQEKERHTNLPHARN